MPRIEFDRPQQFSEVIGDDLHKLYKTWCQGPEGNRWYRSYEEQFITWLLTTHEGSTALARINDFPRQLWLPFKDTARPWKVVGMCPHGNDPAECNDCCVASDLAYDAHREKR